MSESLTTAELRELWNKTAPAPDDDDYEVAEGPVVEAMKIADDVYDYDMSVLCGHEQETIGGCFQAAYEKAGCKITDAVRLEVGRALVQVLIHEPCKSEDCEIA